MTIRRFARSPLHLLWLLVLPCGCATAHPVAIRVRDAETKAPISGAEVHLVSAGTDTKTSATTGPDGIARIAAHSAGDTGVLAEVHAPGYFTGGKDVTNLFAASHPTSGVSEQDVVELFSGPRPSIELVLPVGYRGVVRAEVQVRSDAQPGLREFRFDVPSSGIVEVTGPAILGQSPGPEFRARFADGTQLPQQTTDEAVGFRWLWTEGRTQVFVVGTRADWVSARKDMGHDPGAGSRSNAASQPAGGGRGHGGHRGGR